MKNTINEVLQPENKSNAWSDNWWKQAGAVLVQSVKDLINDHGPLWAAGIAYYSLLSIFPLLLAAASIAAFFIPSPDWVVSQITGFLGEFIPQGEIEINEVVQGAIDARGRVGLLSTAALLWSGSRVFSAITRSLNIAYDVDELYPFIKRTIVELGMLVTVGLLFILAISSRYLIEFIRVRLDLFAEGQDFLYQTAIFAIPGILLLVTFFLIYHFVPRKNIKWTASLTGAILATVLFLVARPLFLGYVNRVAEFNLIYGPVAIVIILIIWAWIISLILLFGGQVASHIQDMVIEGLPPDVVEHKHLRRNPERRAAWEAEERKRKEREKQREKEKWRTPVYWEPPKETDKRPEGILPRPVAVLFSVMGALLLWMFTSRSR